MSKPNTTRLSVLVIGNFLSTVVGNLQHCEELASRLERAGHHVTTTSSRKGRMLRLLDMLCTCWTARRRYQVAQVSVFSGPSFFWAEAVCWMLRRLGKPYVLALHGGHLPIFARKHPRRMRRLLESAALVSSPSPYLQRELRSVHPEIIQIPNALELDQYEYQPRSAASPKLIWLRAFHSIYNPCLAVRVFAALRKTYPEIKLVMAGPDKGDGSLPKVRKLATQLGVADALQLPGVIPKNDVARTLYAGDIFLNTTDADNMPVSVLEAMACGVCIVSTNVGGIPDLLEHERDALLVPCDDPHAMASAVQRIIETGSLRAQLSESARRKVETMNWPVVLATWERVFTDALARRPLSSIDS